MKAFVYLQMRRLHRCRAGLGPVHSQCLLSTDLYCSSMAFVEPQRQAKGRCVTATYCQSSAAYTDLLTGSM